MAYILSLYYKVYKHINNNKLFFIKLYFLIITNYFLFSINIRSIVSSYTVVVIIFSSSIN